MTHRIMTSLAWVYAVRLEIYGRIRPHHGVEVNDSYLVRRAIRRNPSVERIE
jgi:hypothetical protein